MSTKKEFGDFQTPDDLAARTTALVVQLYGIPDLVVEPTAGLAAFLKASVQQWGNGPCYVLRRVRDQRRVCQPSGGLS